MPAAITSGVRFGACFLLVLVFGTTTALAQDLIVSTPVSITSDTTFYNVTIQSGGTLTMDAVLTVTGDMTIESGGVVTHTLRFEPGLMLDVTGTLDVQSGGLIDVNSKGLRGGLNGSAFGSSGEAYDENDMIVAGATAGTVFIRGGAGASYGGPGGITSVGISNLPYGLLEDARHLGSGGAAGDTGYRAGGHGGGLIQITAGDLVADGTIRANGGNGSGYNPSSGGGSGGGIRLDVGTFSGSGLVQSIGGAGLSDGNGSSGSGSGGRISVSYDVLTFPAANFNARGGNNGVKASSGSIYLKGNLDSDGSIVFDNGNVASSLGYLTPVMSNLSSFKTIQISNRGRVILTPDHLSSLTLSEPVFITGSSYFSVADSATITITNPAGFDLNVESSTLLFNPEAILLADAMRISGGIVTSYIDLDFPTGSDIQIDSAGTINVVNGTTLEVEYLDPTNIQNGTIDLQSGSVLEISSGNATINNGVTLIKDGTFGVSDQLTSLTLLSGGVVTHSLRFESGLVLDITGTIDVQAGGLIDLNSKGLRGGLNGSAFGSSGEAYNAMDEIVAGATAGSPYNRGGAGASYAGYGGYTNVGVPNPPYGLVEDARHLGSGGGAGDTGVRPGGHGGGRLGITAENLIINGIIRANGGNSSGYNPSSGGGSGGGIHLDVGTISGGGSVQAVGGAGLPDGWSGSGSGGRITVFYDALNFPAANFNARSGNNGVKASSGTIYLKDNLDPDGSLIFDNGNVVSSLTYLTPIMSNLSSFKAIQTSNRGLAILTPDHLSSLTVSEPVSMTGSSYLVLADSTTLNVTNAAGFDIGIESASTLILNEETSLGANAIRISGGILTAHTDLNFPTGSDIQIDSAGTINVMDGATLGLEFFDGTNIQNGTVDLRSGSTLNIASGTATINSGVTLIKDGRFGITDQLTSMTILSGGVATHSLRYEPGLVLDVTGTLDLQTGGLIDLNSKGLRGGFNGSVFGSSGEAYDDTSGIVAGATAGSPFNRGGAGASYGGIGGYTNVGIPNPSYGLLEEARHLGSGGGAGDTGVRPGGHGGGRLGITAGYLIVDGIIRANGGNASGYNPSSGGGSGGGILLDAGTISGGGSVQSVGGAGLPDGWSGSGGGGRITVMFNSMTLPQANINTRGGNNGVKGSSGTIYLKDNAEPAGTVVFDNANVASSLSHPTPVKTALTTFEEIRISNRGRVLVDSTSAPPLLVVQPLTVSAPNYLVIGSGAELTVSDPTGLDIDAATVVLKGTLTGAVVNRGTLKIGGSNIAKVSGDFTQQSAGILLVEAAGMTAGVDMDRLDVTGHASYAGTLQMGFTGGVVPVESDVFGLTSHGTYQGRFTTLSLPGLDPGLEWVSEYGPSGTSVKIEANYNAAAVDLAAATLYDIDVSGGFVRSAGTISGLPLSATRAWTSRQPADPTIKMLVDDPAGMSILSIDTVNLLATTEATSGPTGTMVGLAVSPFDGTLYSVSGSDSLGFDQLAYLELSRNVFVTVGQLDFNPPLGLDRVEALTFSPSGQLFAVGTVGGTTPTLWEIDIQALEANLKGHLLGISFDDVSFLGNELWLADSATGATTRLDPTTAAVLATGTLSSAGLSGLSTRPCYTVDPDFTARDNPSDAGDKILLDWSSFSAPPGVIRFDIFRSQDECELVRSTATLVASVPAASAWSYVDSVGSDFEIFLYRLDAIVSVTKQGKVADQLAARVYSQLASAGPNVVINEFAPAGGVQKVGEKIELFNFSDIAIDLTGFRISNGSLEEPLFGIIPPAGYLVHILGIDLPDEGGTLTLLAPSGNSFVIDSVSYGTEGGAPAVPAGFTISRVNWTDPEDPDGASFATSAPTFGASNNVAPPNLGGSLILNEVYYDGTSTQDYIELYNPLGSSLVLSEYAISDGVGFVDTLFSGLSLVPGESYVMDTGADDPFDRDLTSTQLYLYQFTSGGLLQLVDQLGWGPSSLDPAPPSPVVPDDALIRIPDGAASYLGEQGTNWVDCGGDITLKYGMQTPGTPNVTSSTVTYTLDSAGGGDFATISDALAASLPGNKIFLEPGTYNESFGMLEGVELIGLSSMGEVIIAGDGIGPAITGTGLSASTAIRNLTIASPGGGLDLVASSAVIKAVHFQANSRNGDGGAVFIDGGSPTFDGCVFEKNTVQGRGGAVFIQSGSPQFDYCLFIRNESTGEGSALSSEGGTPTIENCVFDRNGQYPGRGATAHVSSGSMEILNSVMTFSIVGLPLNTEGDGTIDFGCGLIYGNAASWDTPPTGLTLNNVIEEDPMFCQQLASNYAVHDESPLLALGTTCGDRIGLADPPCAITLSGLDQNQPQITNALLTPAPNPFNPITTLRFELNKPALVDLAIYDVRGYLIARPLDRAPYTEGRHGVQWNGIDRHGRQVSSGVFFVQMKVNGVVTGTTRSMVLLK